MNKNLLTLMLVLLGTASTLFAQITVTDADINAGDNVTWTADNEYHLDGFVYVEEGATLTIEAGTVIKGLPRTEISGNDIASTLIITRGATINAVGTPDAPIIFTSSLDDLEDGGDLLPTDRGLWGGLIILGRATFVDNNLTESAVEGLPEDDDRSLFGGNDDTDNSGRLSFVSIRHGGAELAPGNEINGLTLGAVGSGTQIDHVEVFANSDDGIEWFGGTVDVKYAAVGFCGDDSFDWDLGWRGKGQYFFAIVGSDIGNNAAEMDGAKPDAGTPSSNPQIYNATYIGAGQNVGADSDNEHALLFRDGTRGQYVNSIFTDFNQYAIQVEDRANGVDSRQYMEQGELTLSGNVFWTFGQGNEFSTGENGIIQVDDEAEDPSAQFLVDHLNANNNTITNPMIEGISRDTDGGLDPRPSADGVAYEGVTLGDYPAGDDFFTPSAFKGAFCARGVWIQNWTALAATGVLGDDVPFSGNDDCNLLQEVPVGSRIISDSDLNNNEYNWVNDTIYLLDGIVYLEEGGCLNIEPGTIIKGLPKSEISNPTDIASTLVITRGAKIMAPGTPERPIIFTSSLDEIDDAEDVLPTDRGLWGGLIILGRATFVDNNLTESAVEGLPEDDDRSLFGGNDDADNSGRLSFVSIRHGGAELAPGNEINGLTLGAVGSGTQIDHVEVFANSDDGIEWFGGTVDVKYAAVSYCGDDSYDWDLGWRGRGQYFFALLGSDIGNNAAEMDGAKPDAGTPSSNPFVLNATYIGAGQDVGPDSDNEHALLFRDGTRGTYANSIFTDFNQFAIQVEDRADGVDSRQYMEQGELSILNNIFWSFGQGSEFNAGANGIIQISDDAEDPNAQFLIDHLNNNNNQLVDPNLMGISREQDGGLDPRPTMDGPAYSLDALGMIPNDAFYTPSGFKGAFCNDGVWIQNWTALAQNNILGNDVPFSGNADCDLLTSVEDLIAQEDGFVLTQNYPNPVVSTTEIFFSLPEAAAVTMQVFTLDGQLAATIYENDRLVAGDHIVNFDASQLTQGFYYYTLTAGNVTLTKSMMKR